MPRILALNAYHGGAHQAVLAGWAAHSAYHIDVCGLPPRHWKWRMRHAALSFVAQVKTQSEQDYAAVWCTDMLDVACWRGLAPAHLRDLPHILYMHENQLLYPDQHQQQRDFHYAFTNYTSCCAADVIVWNSAWHRDGFIQRLGAALQKMPDYRLSVEHLHEKSIVIHPGIDLPSHLTQLVAQRSVNAQPHIVWAARWHWEKGPDRLFAALDILAGDSDLPAFTLSVIGDDAARADTTFQAAAKKWQPQIINWGYVAAGDYWSCLLSADMVLSTARHEFFGLALVEACAAGCRPIVPQRLAYPEVFKDVAHALFYPDAQTEAEHVAHIVAALRQALREWSVSDLVFRTAQRAATSQSMRCYSWDALLPAWDAIVDRVIA